MSKLEFDHNIGPKKEKKRKKEKKEDKEKSGNKKQINERLKQGKKRFQGVSLDVQVMQTLSAFPHLDGRRI